MVDLSKFTLHSGGAEGSDYSWEVVGRNFGMTQFNHYYHRFPTPHGNIAITEEEFRDGILKTDKANKTLKRFTGNPAKSKYIDLLARNWIQVKNSEAVFTIARELQDSYFVPGGTGWAVQMAIDNKTPVYVFSQKTNRWYFFNKRKNQFFEVEQLPRLTENFAGIGTRKISDKGRVAIREIIHDTKYSLCLK